jgi:dethiobiotin synthetase
MIVFITGTDTDIGKTLVSSWLCLHTKYDYYKPIQTGSTECLDSKTVYNLSQTKIHQESYIFKNPLSPHMAAQDEKRYIDIEKIKLPKANNIIVEGAGGLLVPLNDNYFIADLISKFKTPVILVARSKLGTINHTLLSLEYLKQKNIKVLGVILSGEKNTRNRESIEQYGKVEVLAELPHIKNICYDSLKSIPLTAKLKKILEV